LRGSDYVEHAAAEAAPEQGKSIASGSLFNITTRWTYNRTCAFPRIRLSTRQRWAYVFTNTADGWRRTADLEPAEATDFDECGQSVAISGKTVVVGAPGHALGTGTVYVFTDTTAGLQQTDELLAHDAGVSDGFGYSVAIAGNTIVVSAPGGLVSHALHRSGVYVFSKTVAGWRQTAELAGRDTVKGDWFGYAIAISGNTIVVGAPQHAGGKGAVYFFMCDRGGARRGWRPIVHLSVPLPAVGTKPARCRRRPLR
jgi:drug/metabolite transporter superfamily protein YnfA